MPDPTRRLSKWNANFNTERIKGSLDAQRADMWTRVQNVFPALALMETQVKQVLDLEGVSVIQYPFYLSFGRELWHILRIELSGDAAAKEASTILMKWKDRGLSQAVLEAIRSGVFNIGAPAP
ncbi:hypothetical protein FJY71_02995 [candidate division WOR-3 bacterium]|nr:hypothetical protein [candidate division WOR-3 bacterium]